MYIQIIKIILTCGISAAFLCAIRCIEKKLQLSEQKLRLVLLLLIYGSFCCTTYLSDLLFHASNEYNFVCFAITYEIFIQCGAFTHVNPQTLSERIQHLALNALFILLTWNSHYHYNYELSCRLYSPDLYTQLLIIATFGLMINQKYLGTVELVPSSKDGWRAFAIRAMIGILFTIALLCWMYGT